MEQHLCMGVTNSTSGSNGMKLPFLRQPSVLTKSLKGFSHAAVDHNEWWYHQPFHHSFLPFQPLESSPLRTLLDHNEQCTFKYIDVKTSGKFTPIVRAGVGITTLTYPESLLNESNTLILYLESVNEWKIQTTLFSGTWGLPGTFPNIASKFPTIEATFVIVLQRIIVFGVARPCLLIMSAIQLNWNGTSPFWPSSQWVWCCSVQEKVWCSGHLVSVTTGDGSFFQFLNILYQWEPKLEWQTLRKILTMFKQCEIRLQQWGTIRGGKNCSFNTCSAEASTTWPLPFLMEFKAFPSKCSTAAERLNSFDVICFSIMLLSGQIMIIVRRLTKALF